MNFTWTATIIEIKQGKRKTLLLLLIILHVGENSLIDRNDLCFLVSSLRFFIFIIQMTSFFIYFFTSFWIITQIFAWKNVVRWIRNIFWTLNWEIKKNRREVKPKINLYLFFLLPETGQNTQLNRKHHPQLIHQHFANFMKRICHVLREMNCNLSKLIVFFNVAHHCCVFVAQKYHTKILDTQ